MHLSILRQREYDALTRGQFVLEREGERAKVSRLNDGRILKFFNKRYRLSSQWIVPPNIRFARNAARLQQLGIAAPRVECVLICTTTRSAGVIYQPVPGDSLLARGLDAARRATLAEFVARLHHQGVYFRGLHLGNIIEMPNRSLGLIDVESVRFFPHPLTPRMRLRNFRHLMRKSEHARMLAGAGLAEFAAEYANSAVRLDADAYGLAMAQS